MENQVPQYDQLVFYQAQVARFMKTLRFRPRLFGVDQADVLKKIEQLNELYETALLAERDRYDSLLEQICSGSADYRDPEEGGSV